MAGLAKSEGSVVEIGVWKSVCRIAISLVLPRSGAEWITESVFIDGTLEVGPHES